MQNNAQIFNSIYMYNSGPWSVTTYLQHTVVPKNAALGISRDVSTSGAAPLMTYNFETHFGWGRSEPAPTL